MFMYYLRGSLYYTSPAEHLKYSMGVATVHTELLEKGQKLQDTYGADKLRTRWAQQTCGNGGGARGRPRSSHANAPYK